MVYCDPGDRLIDPPENFKGRSNTTRHRPVALRSLRTIDIYNSIHPDIKLSMNDPFQRQWTRMLSLERQIYGLKNWLLRIKYL